MAAATALIKLKNHMISACMNLFGDVHYYIIIHKSYLHTLYKHKSVKCTERTYEQIQGKAQSKIEIELNWARELERASLFE